MRRLAVAAALVFALACADQAANKTACEPPSNRVQLLAQARYQPQLDHQPASIRVTAVTEGSFLACLGVRSGEDIVEFDGKPIREAADVSKFFETFGKKRELTLKVQDASGAVRELVNE
jgi:C-terminal processing protease CtpA/Prc